MKKYKIFVRVALGLIVILGIFVCYEYSVRNKKLVFDPEVYYPVISVLDGDTFTVQKEGKKVVTIRMLGINTPETVDPRRSVECFGPEASQETKRLLRDQQVKLILNPKREVTDKYGRYLAYVYMQNNLFLNEYLIEHGYAREYTYGSPYSLQKEFRKIEQRAKKNKQGLWKVCF